MDVTGKYSAGRLNFECSEEKKKGEEICMM